MIRRKKVPTTATMEIILEDLVATDVMAMEAQKLARASSAPITPPETHEIISPISYHDPPLL